MNRGKLTNVAAVQRDRVENAQAALEGALISIDEVIIRTRQAIRRDNALGELLEPGLTRLHQLRNDVRSAKAELNELWADGQTRKWKELK